MVEEEEKFQSLTDNVVIYEQQQEQQPQKDINESLEMSALVSTQGHPGGDSNVIQPVHVMSVLPYPSKSLGKSSKNSTTNSNALKNVKNSKAVKYQKTIGFNSSKKESANKIVQNYAEEMIFEGVDGKLIEGSWFMTPLPCFSKVAPVNVETSPLENLLVEHPR